MDQAHDSIWWFGRVNLCHEIQVMTIVYSASYCIKLLSLSILKCNDSTQHQTNTQCRRQNAHQRAQDRVPIRRDSPRSAHRLSRQDPEEGSCLTTEERRVLTTQERKALATEETRVPGEPGDVPMGNPGFVSRLAGSASHYAL